MIRHYIVKKFFFLLNVVRILFYFGFAIYAIMIIFSFNAVLAVELVFMETGSVHTGRYVQLHKIVFALHLQYTMHVNQDFLLISYF